ncbi:hypothetical protein EAE96_006904 [Botrytis aclada]|nr:hypothetical protein EAE96_006904 [Botrytis aclada]
MASSAEVRKSKKSAKMLLFSEDELPVNKLAGVQIEPRTYQNLGKMAPYLGLPNANAVRDFLNSPEFRRHHDLLYESAIQPRTLREPNSKGPSLRTVQNMIIRGEKFGHGKYSDHEPNMQNWKKADHYALRLYRLCFYNSNRRDGLL